MLFPVFMGGAFTLVFLGGKDNLQVLETQGLADYWGVEDSNLRRLSQQIYSLPHLTALETPHK